MEWSHRTALIIGGSSGMGLGAARALAARGARVRVTSRRPETTDRAVAAVLQDLRPNGPAPVGTVDAVPCDLMDPLSVRGAVRSLDRPDRRPGRGPLARHPVI